MKILFQYLLAVLIVFCSAFGVAVAAYDYPVSNPLAATIVGTPKEFKGELPKSIPVRERTLPQHSDRIVPGGFWYNQELKYSVALQKGPAPLIYVIAGTGAAHDSQKMQVLQKNFFMAGYHVVNIASPSHPNFIVSSSRWSLPGNLWADAIDIHGVMKKIQKVVSKKIEITESFVTGYSLGGTHAAFVSYFDEQEKFFNFKKVLLINPPVSLFNSVGILDAMLDNSPYGGAGGARQLAEEVFQNVVEAFQREDFTEFSEDFLYLAYKKKNPTNAEMAALIGLSFRLSSSNMIFTADVMSKKGYVFPQDQEFGITTSTTSYLQDLSTINFQNYISEMFFPHFADLSPGLTLEHLIRSSSLHILDGYIRRNPKFALITNADDIILAPGELSYLQNLFAGRAWIFPTGGHCGNLEHRDVLKAIRTAITFPGNG